MPVSPHPPLPGPRWPYSRQQSEEPPHPNDSALPQYEAYPAPSTDLRVRITLLRRPIPFAPPFTLQQVMPVRSVGKGIGHFFRAMRSDAFIDPAEFDRQVDDYVRTRCATKPAPGTDGPLIPGDPERDAERERRATGIPLLEAVVQDLERVARETGVRFG